MYRNYSFPPLICQYKFMILFLFVISSKTNVLFCAILHKKRDSISEISQTTTLNYPYTCSINRSITSKAAPSAAAPVL